MRDKVAYILTKRFKAFVIAESIIVGLFLMYKIGGFPMELILKTMTYVQIIAVGYIGTQAVSDIMREYRQNKRNEDVEVKNYDKI